MEKIKKILFINFLISFFLVNLPPFYYIPFIKNPLFSSYTFVRILVLINLIIIFYLFSKKEFKTSVFKTNFYILFLLFFITQSLSVINAINIYEYLSFYKDLIFVCIFLIQAQLVIDSEKKMKTIIKTLLLAFIFNLMLMFLIYFFPNLLVSFFNSVFYDKYVEVLNVNQMRGRFFIEFIDFAFISLIFYQFIFSKRKIHNIYGYILLISLLFLASISNFRTHLLMVLFSLMLTIIFILKKKKKVFLIFSIVLGFLLINYFGLKSTIFPKITIERISFSEEEFGSIIGRFNMWDYAYQMFRSSPLLGIGLGNYYDYLPKKEKTVYSIFKEKESVNRVTLCNVHNIFFWLVAETGLLGLISFIFLLVYFLRQDWNILRSSDILNKSLIISFWTLFLYSFFNPLIGLRFQIIFFILRLNYLLNSYKVPNKI